MRFYLFYVMNIFLSLKVIGVTSLSYKYITYILFSLCSGTIKTISRKILIVILSFHIQTKVKIINNNN